MMKRKRRGRKRRKDNKKGRKTRMEAIKYGSKNERHRKWNRKR